ncbi:MAG: hypothetical protein KAJ30_02285, partial [Candidatus Heimdallarchaeota archaeon]|nr:hypothetical protein [Candidatus Heimdallarchaeota archaeon]
MMLMDVKFSKSTMFQMFAFLFILNVIFSSVVSSNQNLNLKSGDVVEYSILDTSETTNFFYGAWPPGDYHGNWTVNQNEKVVYEITNDTTSEVE